MEELVAKGEKIDVVIMDPPRAGSDRRFLESLAKLSPDRVVYVSCKIETLERDLKLLKKLGAAIYPTEVTNKIRPNASTRAKLSEKS